MQSLTERALERRLKRHLIRSEQRFYLTTLPGLEAALADELRELGYGSATPGSAGVELVAPFAAVYELNLHPRLAQRVLLEVDSFPAEGPGELYNAASKVAWERYIGFAPAFGVQVKARRGPELDLDQAEKVLFKAARNRLSQLGLVVARDDEAPLRLQLRIADGRCALAMDASGSNLGNRDYAAEPSKIPGSALAGFLRWAGAREASVIVDPFCRRGGLALEAAAAAAGVPVNGLRSWGFEAWPGFRDGPYQRARRAREPRPLKVYASDRKESKLAAARAAAERVGLGEGIRFELHDFKGLRGHPARGEAPGLLVSRPPTPGQGPRRGQVKKTFAYMAKLLPEVFPGWRAALWLTDDEELLAGLPLAEAQRFKLTLGKRTAVWVQGRISERPRGKKGKGS